jgi:hypothetical protein
MREMANIFLEKLDRLTVIVTSFHNQNPCPDAMEIIGLLRFGTAEQCMKLSEVISSVQKFTLTYMAFITMLSNKKERSVLKFSFKRVEDDATAIAKLMDEARKLVLEFGKKVKEEELPRIMEAMKNSELLFNGLSLNSLYGLCRQKRKQECAHRKESTSRDGLS